MQRNTFRQPSVFVVLGLILVLCAREGLALGAIGDEHDVVRRGPRAQNGAEEVVSGTLWPLSLALLYMLWTL